METPPIFNSVEDECRYWKERAKHYYKEWIDAKQEFDEFVEDSRQLEAEMEATLEQKDTVVRDLRKQIVQLEKENESLRIKLDSFSIEFANIEKQLTTTQREKDNMKAYLRQLEQKNDDLERAHRILSESIAGFETMLDKAYEKNALLESEVDEKEVLQEKLQRLMDETRDLKQELNVRVRHQSGSGSMNGVVIDKKFDIDKDECSKVFDSQQIQTTTTTTTMMSTGTPMTTLNHSNNTTVTDSLRHPDNMLNGNAMTASSRTTALNIVADMLRKLNLDKTLLCSGCDKFRCICERPLQQNNKNLLSTSTSSMTSSTSSSSCIRNNNSNTTSSNNFGTNIFKRLSQKFGDAITNTSDNNNPPSNNHAMETKLKAYRDQTPTPKQ